MKPGDLLKNLLQQKKTALEEEVASKEGKNVGTPTQKGHSNAHGNKVARVGRGAARGS